MLSRVADSLYWLGRYVERMENVARLLDVNLQLVLEYEGLEGEALKSYWEPVILTTGEVDRFYEHHEVADGNTVMDFLTFSRDNPNSILSCIASARENARMIRDQISSEMWETINRLYLDLRGCNAQQVMDDGPYEFFKMLKNASHHFSGLVDGTFPRGDGFRFLKLGMFLERADKTTRIIDVKYHVLLPAAHDVGGALDVAQWMAVLRSCTALEAYQRVFVSDVVPGKITDFLILSENFPRSIRYCILQIDRTLHEISGVPPGRFSNEAEKHSGRLLSELSYTSIDDIFNRGLHEYLDEIQQSLNEIGESIFDTYMFLPPVDRDSEIQQQQMQQQQQRRRLA